MNNLPPKPSWMSDADYREHAERRARLDAAEWLSPDDVAKDWDVPQPQYATRKRSWTGTPSRLMPATMATASTRSRLDLPRPPAAIVVDRYFRM
jgi:hypothetical protein